MRNFLSISCAFSAAYRARTGPHHTVRIPQYMVRKFRRQWCGNSARSVHFRCISCDFRRSFCASARSCAEIPHGPIRKLVSICKKRQNSFFRLIFSVSRIIIPRRLKWHKRTFHTPLFSARIFEMKKRAPSFGRICTSLAPQRCHTNDVYVRRWDWKS